MPRVPSRRHSMKPIAVRTRYPNVMADACAPTVSPGRIVISSARATWMSTPTIAAVAERGQAEGDRQPGQRALPGQVRDPGPVQQPHDGRQQRGAGDGAEREVAGVEGERRRSARGSRGSASAAGRRRGTGGTSRPRSSATASRRCPEWTWVRIGIPVELDRIGAVEDADEDRDEEDGHRHQVEVAGGHRPGGRSRGALGGHGRSASLGCSGLGQRRIIRARGRAVTCNPRSPSRRASAGRKRLSRRWSRARRRPGRRYRSPGCRSAWRR